MAPAKVEAPRRAWTPRSMPRVIKSPVAAQRLGLPAHEAGGSAAKWRVGSALLRPVPVLLLDHVRQEVGPELHDARCSTCRTAPTSWSSPRQGGLPRRPAVVPQPGGASGDHGADPGRRTPRAGAHRHPRGARRAVAAAGRALRRLRELPAWTDREIPVVICEPRDPSRTVDPRRDCAGSGPSVTMQGIRSRSWGVRTCPSVNPAGQRGRPVAAGLLALVGVGLAVGLIAGLAALVGEPDAGVRRRGRVRPRARRRQSLYLPKPEKTTGPSGPLVTLAPGETASPTQDPRTGSPRQAGEAGQEGDLAVGVPDLGLADGADRPDRRLPRRRGRDPPGPAVHQRLLAGLPGHGLGQRRDVRDLRADQPGGLNRFRVIDTDSGLHVQRGPRPDRG